MQDLTAKEHRKIRWLVNEWREAAASPSGGIAMEMTNLCEQRGCHLLFELDNMGFKGNMAAVQAACEFLQAGGQSSVPALLFRHWFLLPKK